MFKPDFIIVAIPVRGASCMSTVYQVSEQSVYLRMSK
jgi:hypothetical protein